MIPYTERSNIVNMNENKKLNKPLSFAPVIIPTLCRYDHLKKCVESLMKCTWAEETEVYIGLDYPLKESHWEGYKKIEQYLNSLKKTHLFKTLHVVIRSTNLGIGPNGNSENLRDIAFKNHDKLIFTEDDNIFSPSFLVFINEGLEKFRDDSSVFAINGYRHFYDVKFMNNNFYRQNVDFSAWGYGIWRDRYYKLKEASNSKYWRLKAINPLNWFRIYKNGWNRVLGFISLVYKTKVLFDNEKSVYIAINNMDVIMPKESMVRNLGWDGSGEHCKTVDKNLIVSHITQPIYTHTTFDYKGNGKEYYKENKKIYVNQSYGRISFKDLLKNIIQRF